MDVTPPKIRVLDYFNINFNRLMNSFFWTPIEGEIHKYKKGMKINTITTHPAYIA